MDEPVVPTTPTPPEPPKAPEAKEPEQKEVMIPKGRFDEVNAKYQAMALKVEEFEKAQETAKAEAEAKELEAKKEQGKFEELYQASQKELDNYKSYQTRATELETVITGMVEAKLKAVPTEMHDLVPTNLSAEQTLEWINKAEAKGLFGSTKQEAKEVGKPSNKSNEAPKVDKANLSPLNKILAGISGS